MTGLELNMALRLCLLAIVVYTVTVEGGFRGPSHPKQNQGKVGAMQLANLIRKIIQRKAQIKQGNFTNLPPHVANLTNSVCFSNDAKIEEFFTDLMKIKGKQGGVPGNNNGGRPGNAGGQGGNNGGESPENDNDDSNDDDDEEEPEADDLLETVTDSALSCLVDAFDDDTIQKLCHHFAKGAGLGGFKKLMKAGVMCLEHLMPEDDGELEIDDSQQELILQGLIKKKPVAQWTADDLDEAIRGAPDLLDDDILDDISDAVFQQRIKQLGKLLKKGKGRPGLGGAIKNKLRKIKPNRQLNAADLNNIGGGMRAFDPDDIDEMDEDELEASDLEFDDIDDDDSIGLAIGRKLRKKKMNPAVLTVADLKKIFPFIKSDRRYLKRLNAQTVVDALDDIGLEDLDDDEAALLCNKIRESAIYDDPSTVTGPQIRRLGNVLKGCGDDFMDGLQDGVVDSTLSFLKSQDLDDSEIRKLMKKLNINPMNINAAKLKELGKFLKGLNTEELDDIPDESFIEGLDDLLDIDFDDGAERLVIHKIKRGLQGKLPTGLLKNKHLQRALSLDDLDDFDEANITARIEELGDVDWETNLAAHLVRKLLKKTPGKKFEANDFANLGKMAVGVSADYIDDLLDDKEEIFSAAAVLGDLDEDLSDVQSEAMADRIKNIFGDNSEDLSEVNVLRIGRFIVYMDDGEIDKIKFTPKAGKALVNILAKLSGKKLGLLKQIYLFKLSKKLMKAANNDNDDILSEDEVGEMKGSLLGMPANEIRALVKDALLGNLEAFSRLPLTKEQSEAVLSKVEEFDLEYKCKSDRLAQLGPLLQYLSQDKLNALCKDQLAAAASNIIQSLDDIQDRREEREANGLGREVSDDDKAGKRERLEKLIEVIGDSLKEEPEARRRRAISSLTCDQVKILGKQITNLPLMDIKTLSELDIKNCLETLGSFSDWPATYLQALIASTKSALPGTWDVDTIRRIGSILAGLPVDEIRQLALTSVDAMSSTGKHGLMSMDQLKAGFANWLNRAHTNSASAITGPELSSLTEYVCGMELTHIKALNIDAFKQAIRPIGETKSCSDEQLKEFAMRAIAAYGMDISTWEPTVVMDLGRIIGGLDSSKIAQLQSRHINYIKPEIISRFPKATIGAFSAHQINHFSSNQANAVTMSQYNTLTDSQQKALESKATISFGYEDTSTTAGVDRRSPFLVVTILVLSLLPAFF